MAVMMAAPGATQAIPLTLTATGLHSSFMQDFFSRDFHEIDWDISYRLARLQHSKRAQGLGQRSSDASSRASFDAEVERNPYSVKLWLLYLASQNATATETERFDIYERALAVLPRSYKLWYRYLHERAAACLGEPPGSPTYETVNGVFERALAHLSSMPVLWLLYGDFLEKQPLITRTRRCYDRALQTLPITQHHLVWKQYIPFVERIQAPVSAATVYRRYLMYEPTKVGNYITLLKRLNRYDAAACVLARALNEDTISVEGKSAHDLWLELCQLIAEHPADIKSLDIEAVLRSGIRRFTEQVSQLWCSLAGHYILLGQPDKARDVFEEALNVINTVNDFGITFDAYASFLESLLSKLLESETADPVEVDLYLARLESLVQRRPELLSSVKLRQNPNNVIEWLHRVKLFVDTPEKAIKTFTEAVLTVDPFHAVGKLVYLWIQFAKYYESHGDLDNATAVFEKAVQSKFKSAEDLASVWCAWVEFELRHHRYREALAVARRSVYRPPLPRADKAVDTQSGQNEFEAGFEPGHHQHQVFRITRLWSLCVDLEENFGTMATLEACFEKMFDLKVVTPRQLLNYTTYLEEHKYWEKAFRMYERGVAAFRWPHVYDVWLCYLAKFVSRYGGRKLERARELFEQALEDSPKHLSKRLFLMYGKLEETYGLARHAIAVYNRATQSVETPEDVYDFYCLLIAKTTEFFGVTKSRPLLERGIEQLFASDASAPLGLKLGLRFVSLERSLGEIDRARAILQHCSQFCEPKECPEFWQAWREFEIAHGNEDLFREMLRTKRSVQAVFDDQASRKTSKLLEAAQAKLNNDNNEKNAMDKLAEAAETQSDTAPI